MRMLPYRAAASMLLLNLVGCTGPIFRSASPAMFPCRFSPAESWRSGAPCTDHCTAETPPAIRDSAAVVARVAQFRRRAARQNHGSETLRLRFEVPQTGGRAERTVVRESSGDANVDRMALRLMQEIRFVPRRVGVRPVRTGAELLLPLDAASGVPFTCQLVASGDRT